MSRNETKGVIQLKYCNNKCPLCVANAKLKLSVADEKI